MLCDALKDEVIWEEKGGDEFHEVARTPGHFKVVTRIFRGLIGLNGFYPSRGLGELDLLTQIFGTLHSNFGGVEF